MNRVSRRRARLGTLFENELPTPTIARVVPTKLFNRWDSFSVLNASGIEAKIAYIPTKHPKHPNAFARLVALSRLTKGILGGFFTRNARIAFGHGCDRPSYV